MKDDGPDPTTWTPGDVKSPGVLFGGDCAGRFNEFARFNVDGMIGRL